MSYKMIAPTWKLVDCNLNQYLALAEGMLIEEDVPRHEVDTWKETVGCLRNFIRCSPRRKYGWVYVPRSGSAPVALVLFSNLLTVLIREVNCLERKRKCNAEIYVGCKT